METTSVSGKPASRRRHPAVARNIHNLPISFSIQSQLPGKISRSVLAGLYIYMRGSRLEARVLLARPTAYS